MAMMKRSFGTMIALAGIVVSAQTASAQFAPGYTDIGPVIGLGGIGSASVSFGARFEHGIKTLPDLGDGTLGFEVGVDYWSFDCGAFSYTCSYKYIPIGATANYHFKLQNNTKFDPFVGLGLGYEIISCSYSGSVGDFCANSSLYFIPLVLARATCGSPTWRCTPISAPVPPRSTLASRSRPAASSVRRNESRCTKQRRADRAGLHCSRAVEPGRRVVTPTTFPAPTRSASRRTSPPRAARSDGYICRTVQRVPDHQPRTQIQIHAPVGGRRHRRADHRRSRDALAGV